MPRLDKSDDSVLLLHVLVKVKLNMTINKLNDHIARINILEKVIIGVARTIKALEAVNIIRKEKGKMT